MRKLIATLAVIGLQCCTSSRAEAQIFPVWGWGWDGYHASTLAEGFARGIADVIRSQGAYNWLTSQAAAAWEEAARQDIENGVKAVNGYFELRRVNQAYQGALRRLPSQEAVQRYLDAQRPRRLSLDDLGVSGDLRWPLPLTTDDFAGERQALEALFIARADQGGLSPEEQARAEKLVEDMIDRLKAQIDAMRPSDYVKSKQFLVGLGSEARIPLHMATRPVRTSRTF